MSQMPPTDNVDGTATLKKMTDQVATACAQLSDYLANVGVQLHPDIVALLRSEGLDGANRFGMGSSANSTANGFVHIAKRAAEQAEATGKLARALHLYWVKSIKTPVDAAIKARSNQGRPKLKV